MKRIVTMAVVVVSSVALLSGGVLAGDKVVKGAKPAAQPKAKAAAKSNAKAPSKSGIATVSMVASRTDGGANEFVSYQVKLVTNWGEEFTGVVRRTKSLDEKFDKDATLQGSAFAPDEFVEVRWFNGLNGSIGFRFRDVKSIERLEKLTNEHIAKIETKQTDDRSKRLEKEKVRLAVVSEQRAAKKAAEAAVAAKEADAKAKKAVAELESPPQYKAWLDRFPPEKGWIPAKKSQLYYNQVVLGTGALKPDEKDWLDHYEEWKAAFDWWSAEQKALTGQDPPAGTDNPGHATGAIDGENALKLRELPAAIEHDGKTPPVPTDAKDKPSTLDPAVTPPVKTDGM
ncbi:MAG: hypothetical protein IPH13_15920 [Planctomycetes bacterium]|nr:hypothetical protein [Planctomycetota bacterium]MCC7169220.1 hypothetical protein [Planctomycetota bacterium]